MWLIPPEYRLQLGLAVVMVVFGAYGVREIQEAWQSGASTRDGMEALAIGGVLLAILVVVTWFRLRRRPG